MKEWIGKRARLVFDFDGEPSYYTGDIETVDDNFITFIDKFGSKISKKISNLISIEEVRK